MFTSFFHLFFPRVCALCSRSLEGDEKAVCFKCLLSLPKTNSHLLPDNEIAQRFWGKVPIEAVVAFFSFEKEGAVQELLHELKYNNNQNIGRELGKFLAADLATVRGFREVDYIVPVPLHLRKLKRRGYNQSACIAEGISLGMNKPLNTGNLYRAIENPTQTHKSRTERWENVKDIFRLKDREVFANKHILLVDDVLTTGSTIEACTHAILTADNAKVSVATLAVA
jgi:ComF family protein